MTLARWQAAALAVAVAAAVLGFLASVDLRVLPVLPAWLLWLAYPPLIALGAAGATAAVARGREIDAARWAVVDEPLATAQEQEHAHREAERERRLAATVFFAAPVAAGYWGLYLFGADGPGAWMLPIAALAGFVAGYVVAIRRGGPERRF